MPINMDTIMGIMKTELPPCSGVWLKKGARTSACSGDVNNKNKWPEGVVVFVVFLAVFSLQCFQ